jgi:hypothetical protein
VKLANRMASGGALAKIAACAVELAGYDVPSFIFRAKKRLRVGAAEDRGITQELQTFLGIPRNFNSLEVEHSEVTHGRSVTFLGGGFHQSQRLGGILFDELPGEM